MNGIHDNVTMTQNNGYDNSGYYEEYQETGHDTRSAKFNARKNHVSTAAANKSFNAKSWFKY